MHGEKYFKDEDVEIVCDDFKHFVDTHPEVNMIVSPANSFGLMDGGYDAAITEYFGEELQEEVQRKIRSCWHGDQPVGTCLPVKIPFFEGKFLLHTPTMRTPSAIADHSIIYTCMRTAILTASDISKSLEDSIVIPAFGAATGKVPYETVARMMWIGYAQVTGGLPPEINWGYAHWIARILK